MKYVVTVYETASREARVVIEAESLHAAAALAESEDWVDEQDFDWSDWEPEGEYAIDVEDYPRREMRNA